MKIRSVHAREILDSRGRPTIETEITLEDGTTGIAAVPSGASTGSHEVLELRDNDPDRYLGEGVLKAVETVNGEISDMLLQVELNAQSDIDRLLIEMDGTEQKSRLGGNTILSISMAFARAIANFQNKELYEYFADIYWGESFNRNMLQLPTPMILILEGGLHGNWATDFQEYMILPDHGKYPKFTDKLEVGTEVFKATHDLLVKKGYSGTVGFEGAFAPTQIKSNTEAFEIIMEGAAIAGYHGNSDFKIAIDPAATEFYDKETRRYNLRREEVSLTPDEWIDKQIEWYKRYPIWSVEDPMSEDDWEGWEKITERIGSDHQIVADDLVTTNVTRIKECIRREAANAVLIKLNQIGTITETIEAIKVCTEAGFPTVISHRAGESNDDMVADLAVGTPATQTKFGGPNRGERVAKYNRLLKIEEDLLKT